ncbi:bifunctional DNA primase/polymerase [Sinorhizobium meliloti]|uniref:bifunctional DNA primase/polymerase n=1 Tax=Rhizobium meliloti TaxID=382 RepID=UPI00398D361D
MRRPFGDWAETAFDSGYSPIPMNGKQPAVNNWRNGFGANALRRLCRDMPTANLGILLGRIIAIDIDIVDAREAHRVARILRFLLGRSPYIRVGRWPRRMFFYRAESPIKTTRIGSVEILGSGSVAVVLGTHPATLKPYYWPEEALIDVDADALPIASAQAITRFCAAMQRRHPSCVTSAAVPARAAKRQSTQSQAKALAAGRNVALFNELRKKAASCSSKAQLRKRAETINGSFTPPLPFSEVEGVVQSVWTYKSNGTLMVPGTQKIVLPIATNDALRLAATPDALALMVVLRATRHKSQFEIPQKATAKRLGWGSDRRVKKAISILISHGFLREHSRARGPGKAVRVVYGW